MIGWTPGTNNIIINCILNNKDDKLAHLGLAGVVGGARGGRRHRGGAGGREGTRWGRHVMTLDKENISLSKKKIFFTVKK